MVRPFVLVLLLVGVVSAEEQPLWMAVGHADLLAAVKPLADHRKAEGFRVELAAPPLAKALAGKKPAFLLLLGDDAEGTPYHLASKPSEFYRWRKVQPKTFASDALWADRDADGFADCAVGRIPAQTTADVLRVVRKTIAYESRELTPADLRLPVWAGAPGYGGMIDSMATQVLVNTVTQNAPKWAEPWMISADIKQDLCGWPPDQPRVFCESIAKGALLSAMASHANADASFSMRHGKVGIWFAAPHARAFWPGKKPKAPLIFLSCNCGEFDRDRASLNEILLFLPGGPVATIGATTESHPMTNYFTGVAMLKAVGGAYGRLDRLGTLWFEAQRRAVDEKNPLMEGMLKNVEGTLEPEIDVRKLRRDQQRLYGLLGDPALKLPIPEPLEVTRSDDGFWSVQRPAGATTIWVALRRATRQDVPKGDDADARRARFVTANARFSFGPGTKFDGSKVVRVKLDPGLIRFVATGPGRIWVVTKENK